MVLVKTHLALVTVLDFQGVEEELSVGTAFKQFLHIVSSIVEENNKIASIVGN